MPETLVTSQWVPYPVELVFAFFANPANLPHLMPPWQRARIESSRLIPPPPRPLAEDPALRFKSAAAGVGSEMLISFRLFPGIPLRQRWLAQVNEFEWNSHFCDAQLSGPFATWHHRHGISAESQDGLPGTRLLDEIEYTLPLGPLGTLAHSLFVRGQMQDTFAYRQRRLLDILPIAAKQAIQRA